MQNIFNTLSSSIIIIQCPIVVRIVLCLPLIKKMNSEAGLLLSLKFYTIYSKINGFFPFKLTTNGIVLSKFQVAYGVVLILSSTLFQIFSDCCSETDFMEHYLTKLKTNAEPFLLIISYFYFIYHSKRLLKIFNQILKYSSLITNKSSFNTGFWILLGAYSYHLIYQHYYFGSYYYNYPHDFGSVNFLIYRVTEYYFINIHFCLNTLYSISLLFFYHLLLIVNKNFYKVNGINKMCWVEENMQKGGVDNKVIDSIEIFEEICISCQDLNKCFGIPMVASGILTLVRVLFGVFYYVTSEDESILNASLWILYNFFLQWIVLFACDAVVEEV